MQFTALPRPSSARILLSAALFVLPVLAGCAATSTATSTTAAMPALATGNWQFSSQSAAAAQLPKLSGELSGSSAAISGLLHTQSTSSCVAPATVLEVSGSTNAKGVVTLTGPVASGKLTITGTLAADGKSITGATYNVVGGTCAFAQPAIATAQAYTPINGTYTGTFTDGNNSQLTVSATLQQSNLADTSGNFTLNGAATFGSNPCFASPVSVSGTQVTGGNFTMTYQDTASTNQVTVSGTFAPDASTLTVNSWQLTGPCGPDTGSATIMTK